MSTIAAPFAVVHSARPGTRNLTAEDLWKIPRVGAPCPTPDATACVVPVTTWDLEKNQSRSRLWWVPLTGEPRPLTSEEFSSTDPAVSPDGRRLAFARKKDGGKPQIYVMPLDGGEARSLTELPLGAFDPRWLPDGKSLVFAAPLIKGCLTPEATKAEIERRDQDPVKAHVTEDRFYRYWDTWLTTGEVPHLFRLDLAGGAPRDLTPQATWWFDWMEPGGQFDVSPDGSEIVLAGIAFHDEKSQIRASIWIVPTGSGEPRCLTADHPADDVRPRYAPDGESIVYGMQHDPMFYADRVRLMRYVRRSGEHQELSPDWELSPSHWEFQADGTLVIEAEDSARVSMFRFTGSGRPERIVRGGTVSGVRARGGRVWFNQQTLSDPPEVHVLEPGSPNPRRVTRFTEETLRNVALGEVREVAFEGARGEPVQMYVVLPPGYQEGTKVPLVHVIHGGPHAISSDTFHFRWNTQLFASPGYAAAQVNFQGSSSWGQEYTASILGGWGDRPFHDIMIATDLLIASGIADEQRMAATGGSYGGYMVSWIGSHTDRFRCLVNHAGVYDTLSQYASDVTQGRALEFGGEPWEGIEAIDRYNPARFAAGLNTPMLVIHGERDYRVPVTQGLECYGVLKAKGVPARLVIFPDENHWVLKARNSLLWYREVFAWLARWLHPSSTERDANGRKASRGSSV
jgi:dipeptidyl aminopeptidase/acylaminoacyl peptidase